MTAVAVAVPALAPRAASRANATGAGQEVDTWEQAVARAREASGAAESSTERASNESASAESVGTASPTTEPLTAESPSHEGSTPHQDGEAAGAPVAGLPPSAPLAIQVTAAAVAAESSADVDSLALTGAAPAQETDLAGAPAPDEAGADADRAAARVSGGVEPTSASALQGAQARHSMVAPANREGESTMPGHAAANPTGNPGEAVDNAPVSVLAVPAPLAEPEPATGVARPSQALPTAAPAVTVDAGVVVSTSTPGQASTPTVSPPLVDQLTPRLAAVRSLPAGEHVLTIVVEPENFGPVRVVAHITADATTVNLHSATDAGREALRVALGDLRRDLAATGLRADLNVGGDSGASSHQSSDSSPRDGHRTPGASPGGRGTGLGESTGRAAVTSAHPPASSLRGVDLYL
ncbi:flagellar hook-length control protein FliK [Demequina sp.]|uniref:flagellar hook-length control protein FliK n=1 Tax=Demequina sp. TaxID=2050685 RepID=UPI003A84E2CF